MNSSKMAEVLIHALLQIVLVITDVTTSNPESSTKVEGAKAPGAYLTTQGLTSNTKQLCGLMTVI